MAQNRAPPVQSNTQSLPNAQSLRRRFYRWLEPTAWDGPGLSPLNLALVALICIAVFVVVIESEPSIRALNEAAFQWADLIFSLIFLLEYVARVWVVAERPGFQDGWRGRLRYMRTWPAVLDALSLLPMLLAVVGTEAFVLRLFRLLRILRLARFGRFSQAIAAIGAAVQERRFELATSVLIAFMAVLVSATFLHLCEGAGQPATFGSIPRAMWWSVVTLTTVGYGDVYPLTALGKFFAGITALTGIGLIAMPTGILAAAFSDAIQRQRRDQADKPP